MIEDSVYKAFILHTLQFTSLKEQYALNNEASLQKVVDKLRQAECNYQLEDARRHYYVGRAEAFQEVRQMLERLLGGEEPPDEAIEDIKFTDECLEALACPAPEVIGNFVEEHPDICHIIKVIAAHIGRFGISAILDRPNDIVTTSSCPIVSTLYQDAMILFAVALSELGLLKAQNE